jgi:hypothetical protein
MALGVGMLVWSVGLEAEQSGLRQSCKHGLDG